MRFRSVVVIWVALSVGLPAPAEVRPPESLVVTEANSATQWWALLPPFWTAELLAAGCNCPALVPTLQSPIEPGAVVQLKPHGPAQTLQTQHMRLQV